MLAGIERARLGVENGSFTRGCQEKAPVSVMLYGSTANPSWS
jgi:hypothetical protein